MGFNSSKEKGKDQDDKHSLDDQIDIHPVSQSFDPPHLIEIEPAAHPVQFVVHVIGWYGIVTKEPEHALDVALTFEPPDRATFAALDLAYEAARRGGTAPAVYNAADEIAVEAFLQQRLGFLGIPEVLERTMDAIDATTPSCVDDVLAADREARGVAASMIAGSC